MKILHISKYYPPFRGGIEDICYNIVNSVSSHYEQKVICFNDSSDTITSIFEDIEVTRVGVFCKLSSQPLSIKFYIRLKQYINDYRPDIIHLHLPNPLICLYVLLLIPKTTKLIVHWHSDIVDQKILYKLISIIELKILKRADKIIVTSPNYLECSIPLSKFKEKSIVIPNIISLDKIKEKDYCINEINKLHNTFGNNIIFFLGRHVSYKGIEYLIEAEKYIKSKCSILIAGTGPLTPKLKEMAKKAERIKFLGRIEDNEISYYMHAAKIFAFPSITKNEAFGIVLAEAMYCKAVPVTFTIIGSGVNWVTINKKTGLEVTCKNSKEYAKAIDYLLTNDELRKTYAINGYNRVLDNFTIHSIKNDLVNLYSNT